MSHPIAPSGPASSPAFVPASTKARLQRRMAWMTVGIPAAGAVFAVALAFVQPVEAWQIWLLLGMFVLTALGIEGGFHRFFSHRAFCAGRVMTTIIGVVGSMAAQGPILFWAAIHRKHHAHTDADGDPHSPMPRGAGLARRLQGWWHAHAGWLFTVDRTDWTRYAVDLLQDPLVFRLNQYYYAWILLGLAIPSGIGWLMTGTAYGAVQGLLWGGLLRIFLLDQVTWGVNSLCHLFGKRPYPVRGNAGNLAWLALPSLGGAWHHNHHACPASARNDHRPWQLDLTGLAIEALAFIGLATDLKRPGGFPDLRKRRER